MNLSVFVSMGWQGDPESESKITSYLNSIVWFRFRYNAVSPTWSCTRSVPFCTIVCHLLKNPLSKFLTQPHIYCTNEPLIKPLSRKLLTNWKYITMFYDIILFLPDVCAPNPCKNDGSCSPEQKDGKDYKCTCVNGYSGFQCETGYTL